MEQAYVKTTINNKIAEIEFYSPASNSLQSKQLNQLCTAIKNCDDNKQVHIIHLKSAGNKVFCAGASFDELLKINNLKDGTIFFMGFANVINSIRESSKLVVSSIQGKAVGGGVGIAAASDYAFATETASIKLSELSIGIGPFVIEPAITRKIGLTNMSNLSLNTTNWKSAQWAKEVGLFAEVEPSLTELNNRINTFLITLSTYNIEALREMKKIFWQGTEHWNILLKERAAITGNLVLSEDVKSLLAKFKKK